MRLVQFVDPTDGQHVGLVQGDEVVDLSQGGSRVRSVFELYYGMGGDDQGLCDAVRRALKAAPDARRILLDTLLTSSAADRSPA